ncbi:MAG: hypothetical protein RXQ94_07750 [Caldivirga sp.]
MSQVTHIWKVPLRVKIWRSRGAYIGVVNDAASIELLQGYVGKPVTLEIAGVAIKAKLTKLPQKGLTYLAVFLPRRLAPTWDQLREKGELHNAVIVITEGDA